MKWKKEKGNVITVKLVKDIAKFFTFKLTIMGFYGNL